MHQSPIKEEGSQHPRNLSPSRFSPNYKELYLAEKSKNFTLQKELETAKARIDQLAKTLRSRQGCPNCSPTKNKLVPPDPKRQDKSFPFFHRISIGEIKSQLSIPSEHLINDSYKTLNQHCSIIRNFVIFGVSEDNMRSPAKKHETLQQVLAHISPVTQAEEHTAKLAFPSGISVKKLTGSRAKKKAIQIMSFCYTNLKSFLLTFQCQHQQQTTFEPDKNQLLKYVNPEKRLFALCIGFNDYTWLSTNKKQPVSLSNIDQLQSQSSQQSQSHSSPFSSKNNFESMGALSSKGSLQEGLQIVVSPRVCCIYSYYPFFTFYQEILKNIINNVKRERLAIYDYNVQNILETLKSTDSCFQLKRIVELFSDSMGELIQKKVCLNRTYEAKMVNQQKISLLTDWSYAKTYFVDDWVFSILSMFSLDSFIDLFTLVMLEGSVVFFCDNSSILTYTNYLFSIVLTKPFTYTSPIVTILPDQLIYLDAPFSVIYGLLKKRKDIQEAKIVQKYKKTYIFLSPLNVDIVYTDGGDIQKAKSRPSKLKNILNPLFKELSKRKKASKGSNHQVRTSDYNFIATPEEKSLSVQIISKVNQFVKQHIWGHLPVQAEIQEIRNNIDESKLPSDKDIGTYAMNEIISKLKKNNKQPFFEKILSTQMVTQVLNC